MGAYIGQLLPRIASVKAAVKANCPAKPVGGLGHYESLEAVRWEFETGREKFVQDKIKTVNW
jgi:hypothetical protein